MVQDSEDDSVENVFDQTATFFTTQMNGVDYSNNIVQNSPISSTGNAANCSQGGAISINPPKNFKSFSGGKGNIVKVIENNEVIPAGIVKDIELLNQHWANMVNKTQDDIESLEQSSQSFQQDPNEIDENFEVALSKLKKKKLI